MQSICLSEAGGGDAVDDSTQESTLIHQIYGGRLQSQVQSLVLLDAFTNDDAT